MTEIEPLKYYLITVAVSQKRCPISIVNLIKRCPWLGFILCFAHKLSSENPINFAHTVLTWCEICLEINFDVQFVSFFIDFLLELEKLRFLKKHNNGIKYYNHENCITPTHVLMQICITTICRVTILENIGEINNFLKPHVN